MLPPIDELMALTDEQLDVLKEKETNELLQSVSDAKRREKLVLMSAALGMIRSLAPNKLAAAMKIKSLMNASLIKLNDALHGVLPNE